ncbi:MAG: superinfection immunity protein [Opitutales bacterium]|nr:superinfection immunity protein [Opitutales bacterium]
MDGETAYFAITIIALFGGAIIGFLVFLLPTIIAFIRRNPHKWLIFLLNILGSWLLGVGWFLALFWALAPEFVEPLFKKIEPQNNSAKAENPFAENAPPPKI